jgi:predicted O-methyltransferase YrrM
MKTYKDIRGYFGFENFYSHFAENILKDGMNIVEIGAFLGQSTAFMAQKIKSKKLNVKFTVIDHWRGSDGLENEPKNHDMFKQFCDNMADCDVRDVITILKKDSIEAANDFANQSLDLVFIDASHDYENVKKDIAAWLPKVKVGGILAGDDYHPTWNGVVKAVDECFGWNVQKDKLQAWYVNL